MSKKRNKSRRGERLNEASGKRSVSYDRAPRPAFRSEYGNAWPFFSQDTIKPFLEAYITKGTTLQTLTPFKRDSYRTQARLEYTDNQHAGGIARLFGLYVVGTGPRLKFKGAARFTNRETEKRLLDYVNFKWANFADEIRLASILRQSMQTIVVDGEAFLFVAPNPKRSIGFDLKLIDSQRVGNPDLQLSNRRLQDGVYLDDYGNVYQYCFYNVPENATLYYQPNSYSIVPASQVYHLFREDLPGQTRGVSWFAAALPLLQQLREYTAAVIESAKRSAKFVATIETQSGFNLDVFHDQYYLPGEGFVEDGQPIPPPSSLLPYDAWGRLKSDNGDTLILPPGTTQKTFDASQPTTEASQFTNNILGQIGYSLGLPRNKATGSSHEYNFASGRLDNQPFEMLIKTLQLDLFERRCCDRLFKLFYELLLPRLYRDFDEAPDIDEIDWEWVWPEPPLVDAESTARTNAIRVQSAQATLEEVWNETHAFSEFSDVREQIKTDEKDFPTIYGVKEDSDANSFNNTRIDEPKVELK